MDLRQGAYRATDATPLHGEVMTSFPQTESNAKITSPVMLTTSSASSPPLPCLLEPTSRLKVTQDFTGITQ